MTLAPDRSVSALTLSTLDFIWDRLWQRLVGLTQQEYLWEPVADCWSIRPDAAPMPRTADRTAGPTRWTAEWADPEPIPAPVTTIAWRLWHIGSDCLASYLSPALAPWPLSVTGREWFADVDSALAATEQAWVAFRAGLAGLGEDGMWRALGEAWGPYANDTWAALALHAQDELAHHGAEIALLRDLYARGGFGPQSPPIAG